MEINDGAKRPKVGCQSASDAFDSFKSAYDTIRIAEQLIRIAAVASLTERDGTRMRDSLGEVEGYMAQADGQLEEPVVWLGKHCH